MAQVNVVDTLNGLFKTQYADKIADLIPEGVKLLKMIPFSTALKSGSTYNTPLYLGLEHGVSYGGSSANAFTLDSSIASEMQEASVKGCEMVLRSQISVGAVSRSIGEKGAFEQATKLIVRNMLKSMHIRLESQLLYGQVGIARVASVNTGTNVVSICASEWAPGIWSGGRNMKIQFYSQSGTLRGSATVGSVDLKARTVAVDLIPAGVTGNADANNAAADVIYYQSAFGKEFAGLHKMITNTGTIFGIDSSVYDLFKGNVVDVGSDATTGAAVLSFAKIEEAVATSMEKGLMDEDVTAMVHPKQWNSLLTELSAKRMIDSSYSESKIKNGTQAIEFYGQNGKISIVASLFVKEGYSYIFPEKDLQRLGSSDVTFEQPGFEGKFFRLLENVNGYELRAYTDQSLFSDKIGHFTLLRYIKTA